MGWPLGEQYSRASNVDKAATLEGHLLLVVGELDTNVDPASTLQVVAALIRADKQSDLLVVPTRRPPVAPRLIMREVDTPTLRDLLTDGTFYVSLATVYAAIATVIGVVYVLRRWRRNRRRSYRHYYGPRNR